MLFALAQSLLPLPMQTHLLSKKVKAPAAMEKTMVAQGPLSLYASMLCRRTLSQFQSIFHIVNAVNPLGKAFCSYRPCNTLAILDSGGESLQGSSCKFMTLWETTM